jgi:hypothetical protein
VRWHGSRDGQKIFAQRLDAAGAKVGDVITIPGGSQYYPQAEGLSDGGFVLSWIAYPYNGVGRTVAARLAQAFKAAEACAAGRSPCPSAATLLVAPQVAAEANGGFIAAWGAGDGIDALRTAPGGGEVGDTELTTAPISEMLAEGQVMLWHRLVPSRGAGLEAGRRRS